MGIRRATTDDCDAAGRLLYDFNREYDDPAPPPAQIAARLRALLAGGDTVVLLAEDPPVGVAVLRLREAIWSTAKECYLAELYVVPEQRGRGLGRFLLKATMHVARQEGADYIDLTTGEDDTAARALYERLGFSNREGKPDRAMQLYYERELEPSGRARATSRSR